MLTRPSAPSQGSPCRCSQTETGQSFFEEPSPGPPGLPSRHKGWFRLAGGVEEGAAGFPSGDREEACMGVSATVSTQDAAPSPTQLLSPQEQGWKLWTPGRVWKFGEVPGLGGNFLHRARGRDVGGYC